MMCLGISSSTVMCLGASSSIMTCLGASSSILCHPCRFIWGDLSKAQSGQTKNLETTGSYLNSEDRSGCGHMVKWQPMSSFPYSYSQLGMPLGMSPEQPPTKPCKGQTIMYKKQALQAHCPHSPFFFIGLKLELALPITVACAQRAHPHSVQGACRNTSSCCPLVKVPTQM